MEKRFYKNPIIYADYSDPDVIKDGRDFYMVASSFTYFPGVPLLHSRDLVHWELINHCVERLPFKRYDQPAHGCGCWAPSIRKYKGEFYVFVPLPDEGIFVASAENPYGNWKLRCMKRACGWIDPCPFWDDDGKAYMVFAYAHSRCGVKHRISICEIEIETCTVISDPVMVYDGTLQNPTIEGPKLYKRNGYYYIFAPAGGVPYGWQTVLRSRNIYGPYEARIVLHQGNTSVNGPHQGGYVETGESRGAFLHFQDCGAYGRVLHLQPVYWHDNWPFIGVEQNGDGIGEPILSWEYPCSGIIEEKNEIIKDDEFDGKTLGLQWQWQANPQKNWYALGKKKSCLRLFVQNNPLRKNNLLWYAPNILTQLPQARAFQVTVRMEFEGKRKWDQAGLGLLGHIYTCLSIRKEEKDFCLVLTEGRVTEPTGAGKAEESILKEIPWTSSTVWIRMIMHEDGTYEYWYSSDEKQYRTLADYKSFSATACTWTGMKIALCAWNGMNVESTGWVDIDYIRFNE